MIGLLPIGRIIALFAVSYAALLVAGIAVASVLFEPASTVDQLRYAALGSMPIQLGLSAWFYLGWRRFWRWFPSLNSILYPDLGDDWLIDIQWTTDRGSGLAQGKAKIRQSFLQLSMEVDTTNSQSITLAAHPRKEPQSNRPLLDYIYQVTTKPRDGEPSSTYQGAAVLRFDEAIKELSGNYSTSRHTSGTFRLHGRCTPGT